MTLTAKIHKVFDEAAKTTGGSWVKAIASVTIGDDFAVHGVKVLAGSNGEMVVMPATKYKDRYQDTFHPINREARTKITNVVLDAYARYLSQDTRPSQAALLKAGVPQDMTQVM